MSCRNEWCLKVNIMFTPTIYINEYELPNWYKVEDLIYFIRQ